MTYFSWMVPVVFNGTLERIGALMLTSQSDESNEVRRFLIEPCHNQPVGCLMHQHKLFTARHRGTLRCGETQSDCFFQHSFHSKCFFKEK